jgi:hypothetical protein
MKVTRKGSSNIDRNLLTLPDKLYDQQRMKNRPKQAGFGLVLWSLMPLSTIWWSVLIGGGNRSTRRKQPTCRKSLTNFFT